MLKGMAVIAFLSLSGCAGTGVETAEMYRVRTETIGKQNKVTADITGQAIDALVRIEEAKIAADTKVKLAKINRPNAISSINNEECFDTCQSDDVPPAPLAVTGDGNLVVVGSTGVDIQQEEGKEQSADGLENTLLSLITQPVIPVPVAPIIKGAGAQAIETGGRLLGKALDVAPWAIGAYKIGGALEAGASRDSNVVYGNDNTGQTIAPITTTTITDRGE